MPAVDNDTFLQKLTELFQKTTEHGTIWLTHKRLTYNDGDVTMKTEESAADEREYPCILRATNGKQIKFSTLVNPGDLHRFHSAYGTLLKTQMTTTLRKRDKKREKQRAEDAALRRQRMTTPIVIEGAKRGAGRRKRQKRIKAAMKQLESLRRYKEREEAKSKAEGEQSLS